jgi:membrane associated rhomboid family serine protease
MMDAQNVIACGMLLQVAYVLLADSKKREDLQTRAPVTAFAVVLLASIEAAIAAGPVRVSDLSLAVDSAQLTAEPWRLLSCVLVYHRIAALATHLWLLLKVGPNVEERLGSSSYATLLCFSAVAALGLRTLLLTPEQRPDLLTASPLFTLVLVYSKAVQPGLMPAGLEKANTATATNNVQRLPGTNNVLLPWLLLLSVACLDGDLLSAVPGLLGIGAGGLFEAMIGLPPPPLVNGDTNAVGTAAAAAAPAAAAASAAGGTGEGGGAGDVPAPQPQPSIRQRLIQGAALLYLISSYFAHYEDLNGPAQLQCGLFAASLDISEPITSQLTSNFTSERLEMTADIETALRAYEWLAIHWKHPEAIKQPPDAEAAADAADAATARQTLYEAQVHAREAARVQHRA